MSAQSKRLKQKTQETISLQRYLASSALLLSLTALLFSLLAFTFTNASCTAEQLNTVGKSFHQEVCKFLHLDIQVFADLQKFFVVFTPVECGKNFPANYLDYN